MKFDKKKKVLIVVPTFLVAALAASFLFRTTPATNSPSANEAPAPVEALVRRKIDGVLIAPDKSNLKLFGVMIENHPESRPPSGLSKAKLVWEAPVEGGITRYMAVYDGTEGALEIGPVRSARPYYLEWAKEIEAAYVHVGGSPEALEKIPSFKVFSLNQFFQSQYFWRSARRPAPHNVYTSSDLLNLAARDKELTAAEIDSWLFKDDLGLEERPKEVKDLVIEFSTPEFQAKWVYDAQKNEYSRYLAKRPHTDIDTEAIKAKNVIVQFARVAIIDSYGRRRIETVDEGRAVIALDGKVIQGSWKKSSRASRTKFYDEKGDEISYNAGTTWIEVVPKGTEVLY